MRNGFFFFAAQKYVASLTWQFFGAYRESISRAIYFLFRRGRDHTIDIHDRLWRSADRHDREA